MAAVLWKPGRRFDEKGAMIIVFFSVFIIACLLGKFDYSVFLQQLHRTGGFPFWATLGRGKAKQSKARQDNSGNPKKGGKGGAGGWKAPLEIKKSLFDFLLNKKRKKERERERDYIMPILA